VATDPGSGVIKPTAPGEAKPGAPDVSQVWTGRSYVTPGFQPWSPFSLPKAHPALDGSWRYPEQPGGLDWRMDLSVLESFTFEYCGWVQREKHGHFRAILSSAAYHLFLSCQA
jgi:hypothetical protein